jgi:DNA (cytosine-5)-methyltransferase 1
VIYGSVCSGIEAASAAWHPLGWRPAFFSEIEAFPRAVLAERWPGVPTHGDLTTIEEGEYEPVELLVGGTPCQDFSVAGLRAGLAGERGNLTIEFVRLARRLRPRWVVWENVPGVLSIDGGRAFGAFLGGLGKCGYGFAYRVLDAQFAGVPQRRRRVFVVGYLGDWRPAAAVLFEPESLRGDPPPRREAGQGITPILEAGARTGHSTTDPSRGATWKGDGADNLIADTLSVGANQTTGFESEVIVHGLRGKAHMSHREDSDTLVAYAGGPATDVAAALEGHPVRHDYETETFVTGHFEQNSMGGRGTLGWNEGDKPLRPVKPQGDHQMLVVPPLMARSSRGGSQPLSPGFGTDGHIERAQIGKPYDRTRYDEGGNAGTLSSYDPEAIASAMTVRRLTPREYERLQGFPDDYTLVAYRGKPAADGPRYRALGNSMAVPCMRWLGERIDAVARVLRP